MDEITWPKVKTSAYYCFIATCVALMASALTCVFGCSLLAPGADTREALAARQETDYDAEGNFSTIESTTHERNNVVLEGENVTAEFSPSNGKLIRLTGATNVMVQISRPRDAADAKMSLDALNLQFGLTALDTLRQLVPYAIQRIGPQTQPAAPRPVTGEDRLADLLRQLREQGIEIGEPQ